jgi:hypothetical protein
MAKTYTYEDVVVRFYDDDSRNILDASRDTRVEAIHVASVQSPGQPRGTGDNKYARPDEYMTYVIEEGKWDLHKHDSDLATFIAYRKSKDLNSETYVSDALTEQDMSDVCKWAMKTSSTPSPSLLSSTVVETPQSLRKKKKRKVVVFDFDRVINRVEGIFLVNGGKSNVRPSGIAKYSIGTKSRLEAFRKMIDCILNTGNSVYIVTNNSGYGPLFVDVLHALHPHFNAKNVISSLPFKRNKLLTMYKHGILPSPSSPTSSKPKKFKRRVGTKLRFPKSRRSVPP